MQSPIIFITEFQTAKSRLLKNFGLSDHRGFSRERDDDAQGREERLCILKPWIILRPTLNPKLAAELAGPVPK